MKRFMLNIKGELTHSFTLYKIPRRSLYVATERGSNTKYTKQQFHFCSVFENCNNILKENHKRNAAGIEYRT